MFISPFLAVQASFWPILVSLILFSLMGNFVLYINFKLSLSAVIFSVLLTILVSFLWWKDFSRERMLGYHTHKLELSLRIGILLFILSEVFFFVSFFWAFYDSSLSPSVELGLVWPPMGIIPLSVYSVPLLNTVILLTRGITVTWAHHSLINNFFSKSFLSLLLTIVLGVYFLYMQYIEYSEAQFAISDGVYGSTFFYSNWLSRYTCYGWYPVSFLLFVQFSRSKATIQPSFLFWSCCLILTFCRCSVTYPFYFYLLMREIIIFLINFK